jgi:excisionase family DNA binding protein
MSFVMQMCNMRHVKHSVQEAETARMASTGGHAFFGDGASLLTVAEVASSMRVSTMTVYRLIKSGDLPAVRVGHNYRVRGADVERYLTSRSVQVEGS